MKAVGGMKVCVVCRETKPVGEFYKNPTTSDGLCCDCKVCRLERERRRYAKNPEGERERRRNYYRANRDKELERHARFRRENPEKDGASRKVNDALKLGHLTKPTACEECGAERPLDGHHDDYSKPLEVRWLCRPCHFEADRQRRRAEVGDG